MWRPYSEARRLRSSNSEHLARDLRQAIRLRHFARARMLAARRTVDEQNGGLAAVAVQQGSPRAPQASRPKAHSPDRQTLRLPCGSVAICDCAHRRPTRQPQFYRALRRAERMRDPGMGEKALAKLASFKRGLGIPLRGVNCGMPRAYRWRFPSLRSHGPRFRRAARMSRRRLWCAQRYRRTAATLLVRRRRQWPNRRSEIRTFHCGDEKQPLADEPERFVQPTRPPLPR